MPLTTTFIKGRKLDDLVTLMKNHDYLVDVRYSTSYPLYFNQASLLAEFGSRYLYFHELGNPPHYRPPNVTNLRESRAKYEAYLLTNRKAGAAIQTIVDYLLAKKAVVLMCYCATLNRDECHRFWLETMIRNRPGWQ